MPKSILVKMADDWQKWQKQFRVLEEYRHLNPDRWPGPNTRFPGRNALGAWCARQQREYKRNNLSRPRLKKLLDLGFPLLTEKSRWERRRAIYTYHERGWLLRFEDLRAYRRRHPDRWPKSTDSDRRIRNLSGWLSKNRSRSLRPEFKRLLKTMGVDFARKNREDLWDKQFRHLQKFRKKNPHRWPQNQEKYPAGNSLGNWVFFQRRMKKKGTLAPKREKKLRSMGFVFVLRSQETLDAEWDRQFRLLQNFRKKNPYWWPSDTRKSSKRNSLGIWVYRHRALGKKGVLRPDRKRKLLDIGFDFTPDRPAIFDARWNRQFRHLQEFRKEYPDRWPRQMEEYPPGNKLGIWVNVQRRNKTLGILPPDLEQKLRAMEFDFAPDRQEALDKRWNKQVQYLKKFRQKNPHRWPSSREEYPPGNQLGTWVETQRQIKRRGNLRKDREEQLRSIAFDFSPVNPEIMDAQWNVKFRHLQNFRKANPHRWPGQREEYPEGNYLAHWLDNQREKKKRGALWPEHEQKLSTIGYDFALKKEKLWDKQFRYLQDFRKEYPHRWPRQTEEYPEGNNLGRWINKQCQKKKKGRLPIERERKLSAFGFHFAQREVIWERKFQALRTFHQQHGRWPFTHEEFPRPGDKLGRWLDNQKVLARQARLRPERRSLLAAIGFPFELRYD